ncbi:MAG: sensor histidine kinase [Trebonia sp.]
MIVSVLKARLRNAVPSRLILLDALAAAGFLLLPLGSAARPAAAGLSGVAWGLSAAVALPLCVRRLWPVPVFLVVLALACTAVLLGLGPAPLLAAAYAVYTVAVTRRRPLRLPAAVAGTLSAMGAALLTLTGARHYPGGTEVTQIAFGVVALGATWAVGAALRDRREAVGRAIEQAAERGRIEERMRVARDVHDVATHSIGLIAVKAGIANHVLSSHPEEARAALAVIEQVSRAALRDMRTTLRVLRPGQHDCDGLRPGPGLADIPALAETVRAAGLDVQLHAKYEEQPPDGVAVSAYRIVQEALTNAAKHAGPTRCDVTVVADAGLIRIEVSDDGPWPGRRNCEPDGGFGLIGMRERAASHGGTLDAGPRPGGGFQVTALLRY